MMKTLRSLLALNYLAAAVFGLGSPALATSPADVGAAFGKGDFSLAIRAYDALPEDAKNKALPLFWTGFSYMRRHDFKIAGTFIDKALNENLPPRQREVATAMSNRLKTIDQLWPPLMKTCNSDGFTINFYAQDTAWGRTVVAQGPQFTARAKEAFGSLADPTNFYLFDQRDPYDRFYDANSGKQPGLKHRGAGSIHLVLFCQFFPNGEQIGAKNPNDLYSRVAHEYCHSLCNTIYGDQFLKDCPQWANESMADYFGWKFRPERYAQVSQDVAKLAAKYQPPSYEDLCTRLYEQPGGYLIPDLILLELLKGKDVSCFNQILQTARAKNGDFEAAFRLVTGKDPRTVYQEIKKNYWHQ